jgi:transcriptional regulator with XRE-family HTH domain
MPETTRSPHSVARSQLGALLAELRVRAELTLSEAAATAKTDAGSLSRVERGQRGLKPETAERLLDCYQVHDATIRNEVLELLRVDSARRRRASWWQRHREVLSPTQFDGYLALESSANSLRNYEALLVPGLLQTHAYAREVIASMRPDLSATKVQELVAVRMARQAKVLGSGEKEFFALIDEAALARTVGGTETMREQLGALLQAAQLPRTTVRLLPLAFGAHPGLAGAFVVMSFPVPARDVVWVETMKRSLYFEEQEDAELYTNVFETLWQQALTPEATHLHLEKLIKELQ